MAVAVVSFAVAVGVAASRPARPAPLPLSRQAPGRRPGLRRIVRLITGLALSAVAAGFNSSAAAPFWLLAGAVVVAGLGLPLALARSVCRGTGARAVRAECGHRSGRRIDALDQDAAFEACACAGQGDEMGCVDGTPPLLGGLNELERHGQASRAAVRSFGDAGAMSHGGEG
jgi:hypothetical protein